MRKSDRIVLLMSTLGLSWFLMMATHELGHVTAAWLSGGSVRRVVLHPAAISRTDVEPNPHPLFVVWAGPIVGCLLPLAASRGMPNRSLGRPLLQFAAGFCLIANGAYISVGSFDGIGDAGEMLRLGTPRWLMLALGSVAVISGFFVWHQLGSLRTLRSVVIESEKVLAITLFTALLAIAATASVLSSR